MERDDEQTGAEGAAERDYGGMGQSLDGVDLEGSKEVGADPPGGLGADIGGGTGELGADEGPARSADAEA